MSGARRSSIAPVLKALGISSGASNLNEEVSSISSSKSSDSISSMDKSDSLMFSTRTHGARPQGERKRSSSSNSIKNLLGTSPSVSSNASDTIRKSSFKVVDNSIDSIYSREEFDIDFENEFINQPLFTSFYIVKLKSLPKYELGVKKKDAEFEIEYEYPEFNPNATQNEDMNDNKPYNDPVVRKAIPGFCFPDVIIMKDDSLFSKREEFTFVVTNGKGQKSYGFCKRQLSISPGQKAKLQECYCFVTNVPWYSLWNELISFVAMKTRGQSGYKSILTDHLKLMMYVKEKSLLDSKLLYKNALTVTKSGWTPSPREYGKFVLNLQNPFYKGHIDLEPLCTNLSPTSLRILFASLLSERRIILTSSNLTSLSACIHGAVALLAPFSWHHIFIPIMPESLVDYCAAPMPFLIGIHSNFIKLIERLPMEEVVVIDIDTESIVYNNSDVQSIPKSLSTNFVKKLSNCSAELEKTGTFDRDRFVRAFQKFFLSLFRSYGSYIKYSADSSNEKLEISPTPSPRLSPGLVPNSFSNSSPRTPRTPRTPRNLNQKVYFDTDSFIAESPKAYRSFLKSFRNSQMFEMFKREVVSMFNENSLQYTFFYRECQLFRESRKKWKSKASSLTNEGLVRRASDNSYFADLASPRGKSSGPESSTKNLETQSFGKVYIRNDSGNSKKSNESFSSSNSDVFNFMERMASKPQISRPNSLLSSRKKFSIEQSMNGIPQSPKVGFSRARSLSSSHRFGIITMLNIEGEEISSDENDEDND